MQIYIEVNGLLSGDILHVCELGFVGLIRVMSHSLRLHLYKHYDQIKSGILDQQLSIQS